MKKRNAAKLRTHVVTQIKGIEKGTGKQQDRQQQKRDTKEEKGKTGECEQLLINQK